MNGTPCSSSSGFNPRSHVGSDTSGVIAHFWNQRFNPRSHVGSDHIKSCYSDLGKMFQSTLPRRERPCRCIQICFPKLFQSTLPRRERRNFSQKFITIFSRNQQIIILHTLFSPFSSPLFSTLHFICAHFRVRITRHFHVCFLFALLYHKINVSSTAIPRSTPICSTFV